MKLNRLFIGECRKVSLHSEPRPAGVYAMGKSDGAIHELSRNRGVAYVVLDSESLTDKEQLPEPRGCTNEQASPNLSNSVMLEMRINCALLYVV